MNGTPRLSALIVVLAMAAGCDAASPSVPDAQVDRETAVLPSDADEAVEPSPGSVAARSPEEAPAAGDDAALEGAAPTPNEPRFEADAMPLPDAVVTRMRGSSWREGCPIPLEDLRFVTVTHHTFDGQAVSGELVVHADVAESTIDLFRAWFELGFAIERMVLVDDFGADDDRSMAANNTSAFNCRTVAGTTRWSEHAYGEAIDVNPVQNPYVRGGVVEPAAGAAYLDRSNPRSGMLIEDSPEIQAAEQRGWQWGGRWTSSKDYQHFSRSGR